MAPIAATFANNVAAAIPTIWPNVALPGRLVRGNLGTTNDLAEIVTPVRDRFDLFGVPQP